MAITRLTPASLPGGNPGNFGGRAPAVAFTVGGIWKQAPLRTAAQKNAAQLLQDESPAADAAALAAFDQAMSR